MHWYVVRTATRQEKRAVSALGELGFEVYCPMLTRYDRIGRLQRREERKHPLFPGYLFARIGMGLFAAAEAADGVSSIVRYTTSQNERSPCRVPSRLVAELRDAEAAGAFDKTRSPEDEAGLKAGDLVRIKAGGWWGHNAVIVRLDGPGRVKVLHTLFGRTSEATYKLGQVEKI